MKLWERTTYSKKSLVEIEIDNTNTNFSLNNNNVDTSETLNISAGYL